MAHAPRVRKYFVLRSEPPPPVVNPFESTGAGPLLEGIGARSFGVGAPAPPVVTHETITTTPEQAADLRRAAGVKSVAESLAVSLVSPLEAPPAPGAADPVAEARAAKCAWGVAAVGAATSPYDGTGVTVAILDTGIKRDHPAFAGVEIVAHNFTDSGAEDDVTDNKGHGTHCAGTFFGRDVEGVRIGVARGVRKALIGKVLDDNGAGATDAVYEALLWAYQNGANVISLSLGFNYARRVKELEDEGKPTDFAISLALQAYRENMRTFESIVATVGRQVASGGGAVVVAAAGNDSRRDLNPDYVIDVAMPAATLRVLSVGALARNGAAFDVAPFSNTNPIASAPGVGIVSASKDGGLVAMSGTSMACPHVAGVEALWWQRDIAVLGAANPDGVASRVRGRLRRLVGLKSADSGEGLVFAPQDGD